MYDLFANCLYVAIAVYTTFLQSYAQIHHKDLGPTAHHCFQFFVYWTYIKAFNDVLFLPGTVVYDIMEMIEHVVFLLVYIILLGTIGDKIAGLYTAWVHISIVIYFILVAMYIKTMFCGGRTDSGKVKRITERRFVRFNGLGLLIATAAASLAEIVVTAILDAATPWTANQVFCIVVVFNEGYSWGVLFLLRWLKQIEWKYSANVAMRHLLPRMFILVGICIVATDVFANQSLDPIDFSFIWFPLVWMLMPSAMLMEVEVLHPLKLPMVTRWFDKLEHGIANGLARIYLAIFKKKKPVNNNNNVETGYPAQDPNSVVIVTEQPTANTAQPSESQLPSSPQPIPVDPSPVPVSTTSNADAQVPLQSTSTNESSPIPDSSINNNNDNGSQPTESATQSSVPATDNNTPSQEITPQPQEPSLEASNSSTVQ